MISITYRIAQIFSYLYLKIFHRLEIEGLDNIPDKGAFIMASNHASFIDPPALGCRVNRNLHYFARDSLFVGPLGYLIRKLNSIPVNRGQLDLKTLRITINTLKKGNPLLVFPEGTRSHNGQLGTAKKGIGLLVSKTQCDILPVFLSRSYEILGKGKFFPRVGKKLKIKYGKLIRFKSLDSIGQGKHQEISDFVLNEIKNLRN